MQENDKNNEHNNASVALTDLTPDPVAIIDIAGKIFGADRAVGKYKGYKPEELVRENFLERSFDYSRGIHLELQECSLRQMMLECLAMIQVPEKVKIVGNFGHKQILKAEKGTTFTLRCQLSQNLKLEVKKSE